MKLLATVPHAELDEFAALPEEIRREVHSLLRTMSRICAAQRGQIGSVIEREATALGQSAKTIRALWDEFRKTRDWRVLVDWRKCPDRDGVRKADAELFRKFCGENQRKSKPAHRAMVRAWRRGEIQTDTPIDPRTGLPHGWSYRNLMRHQPSRFEITAMRQGLGAAIGAHMGKVITTRAGLWVGSHYMADDVLRDFKVLLLSGAAGKEARVGELGVLDVLSGHRFAVHRRPIYRGDDGKKDSIKEREMRFLVAAVLRHQGYSPRGTEWIVELGTAAIRKPLAKFLHDHSTGPDGAPLITVRDAGITGREQAIAGYIGTGGGNPRHKARLESHHNLLHNEAGHLLAQTGHDRNPPEWLHGIERETEAVIKWIAALPPERAELCRAPMLEYWQSLALLQDLDNVIATRTDHDLEGWEQCGHTTIEYRLDLSRDEWISQREFLSLPSTQQERMLSVLDMVPSGLAARPRKLSPVEAWKNGAGDLIRFPDHVIALMFCDRALGDDLRVSRRLNQEGEFSIADKTIEPGDMIFRGVVMTPAGELHPLHERAAYGVVVNPFDRDALWVYDQAGGYIGTAPRKHRATMLADEISERQRTIQLGHRAHDIAALTAPLRERHADISRTLQDVKRHNRLVASGADVTAEEKQRTRDDRRQALDSDAFLSPAAVTSEPADDTDSFL